jgi:dTDP-4-amino-4,6-dideoxygalactose transaminase
METLIHYPVPPHLTAAYAAEGWKQSDFQLTEALSREILSLPIGPHLRDVQIAEVAEIVKRDVRSAE